jgi:hypothetical protein
VGRDADVLDAEVDAGVVGGQGEQDVGGVLLDGDRVVGGDWGGGVADADGGDDGRAGRLAVGVEDLEAKRGERAGRAGGLRPREGLAVRERALVGVVQVDGLAPCP